jgi:hypothetical protein
VPWTIRPAAPGDAEAAAEVLSTAGVAAWGRFLGEERVNERGRGFYERNGWRAEGPPRVRDWHGVRLCEPRYVKDL